MKVLKGAGELAVFIAEYWIEKIEGGRLEMPFKGRDEVTDVANLIRAIQTAETQRIFSLEQIELIKARTKEAVERALLEERSIYGYTHFGWPHRLLEKMFAGMEIPHGRFPFEERMLFFSSKEKYEESFDEARWNIEDRNRRVAEYPGEGGVICRYLSGGGWEILAAVQM